MRYVLTALSGYLIGSVSGSILITKYIFKDDVRNHGSGNAGATNVARTYGWIPGIITFFCDFLKCVLAIWLGKHLLGEWGMLAGGAACLIGHCFPLYFGFRGGKAVSTGACVAALIDWRLFLIVIAVFAAVAVKTKIVSISSLAAAIALITAVFFVTCSLPLRLLGVFTGLLVIFMHRSNVSRLLKGEEQKFSPGHRK